MAKKTRIVVELYIEGDPEMAWRVVDNVLSAGTFQDAINGYHELAGGPEVTVRRATATTARQFAVSLIDEGLGNVTSFTAVPADEDEDEGESTLDPEFRPIAEEDGLLMTLEEFVAAVKSGGFIDDDGDGEFATATTVSDVPVFPSSVYAGHWSPPVWATHVCWYNK